MNAKTTPGRIPAWWSKYRCGRYDEVKDATKIGKIRRLAKFHISFCFVGAFHDTRTAQDGGRIHLEIHIIPVSGGILSGKMQLFSKK